MDENTVIKVEKMYKKFCRNLRRSMAYGTIDLTRNFLGLKGRDGRLRKDEFWALEDINFEIKKGESVGIIGLNGSGKSTLLRLLSGIFPPDRGKITVRGSIGALIAVGAGFHPHMTGRENIYLNGTILGMNKEKINETFEKIVNFADIGEFLDAPVSTYSSGMRIRLGFSIAIHAEPNILLVDEILSVGDLSFRNKCFRYMGEYKKRANALLFVSHDIEQIRLLCERVILIEKGKIIYDGDVQKGIVKYEEITRDIRLGNLKEEMNELKKKDVKRSINDGETIKIRDFQLVNNDGKKKDEFGMNEPLNILCEFEVLKDVSSLSFYIGVNRDDTELQSISVVSNDNNKMKFEDLKPGKYKIMCAIDNHHLIPGVYNPSIGFRNDKTFETYQKVYSKITFRIRSDGAKLERGFINVDEKWSLKKIN